MKKKFAKYLILFLALAGLYYVTTGTFIRYPANSDDAAVYSTKLTEEEIVAFLPVWKKFRHKFTEIIGESEVSFSDKKTAEALPSKISFWLRSKNFEPNRFFFIEQRIYDLTQRIYLQKHSKDTIAHLQKSLEKEQSESSKENIRNIIAKQEEILNFGNIDSEEMKIIQKHYSEILSILQDK